MKSKEEIIKTINEVNKKTNIVNAIKFESIETYVFLQKEFNSKRKINENHLFMFVYSSFYGMKRAGLIDAFYVLYFSLMEEYKNNSAAFNFKKEVTKFSKLKLRKRKKNTEPSNQFSFLTKLHHTIDNSKPIWDKHVCKTCEIYQYHPIDKQIVDYNKIEKLYKDIQKNEELDEIVKEFKVKFKNYSINNTMIYDFIFWQCGKIINQMPKKKKKTTNKNKNGN